MADTLSFQDAVQQVKTADPETATEVETEQNEADETENVETIEIELEEDTAAPDIEAPNSWSNADKEVFNTLTPEGQEVVLRRERETRANESKRLDELSVHEKTLNERDEQTKQKQAELVETLTALKIQKPTADLLDENHESYNPDEYHRQNAAHEKSLSKVDEATQALQTQQTKDFVEWQAVQASRYKEKWPEFLDVEAGPKLHNDLISYASKKMGLTVEQATQVLRTTSFEQMSILNDGMRYNLAIANAKAKKAKPTSKSLKSGTSNPKKSEKKDVKALAAAFVKDRSGAAASALLKANKG